MGHLFPIRIRIAAAYVVTVVVPEAAEEYLMVPGPLEIVVIPEHLHAVLLLVAVEYQVHYLE